MSMIIKSLYIFLVIAGIIAIILDNMKNIILKIWNKVYASTINYLPLLGSDAQTRLSWAKVIESYDDVPTIYKDFFKHPRISRRQFPYTILTPDYRDFIHKSTEKLVCDFGREIYILEKIGDTFKTKCYPVKGISCVEIRTVLLDTYIKIIGVTRNGIPDSTKIRMNSVTTRLFTPIIEGIRQGTTDFKGSVQSSELAKFDNWIELSLKFTNYAKSSILSGEKVIHSIFQPEIRKIFFKIMDKAFYRILSRAVAIILTDRELIVIQDAERIFYEDNSYGGIWNYIPLNKIGTLSLGEGNRDLLVLSIHLLDSIKLEYMFQASAKRELDQLLHKFRELSKV